MRKISRRKWMKAGAGAALAAGLAPAQQAARGPMIGIQVSATGHSHRRNEAESGLFALRLACLPREASPAGLLQPTLTWLPEERAILRVSSFQLTRSARFILAHQMTQMALLVPTAVSVCGTFAICGHVLSGATWHA